MTIATNGRVLFRANEDKKAYKNPYLQPKMLFFFLYFLNSIFFFWGFFVLLPSILSNSRAHIVHLRVKLSADYIMDQNNDATVGEAVVDMMVFLGKAVYCILCGRAPSERGYCVDVRHSNYMPYDDHQRENFYILLQNALPFVGKAANDLGVYERAAQCLYEADDRLRQAIYTFRDQGGVGEARLAAIQIEENGTKVAAYGNLHDGDMQYACEKYRESGAKSHLVCKLPDWTEPFTLGSSRPIVNSNRHANGHYIPPVDKVPITSILPTPDNHRHRGRVDDERDRPRGEHSRNRQAFDTRAPNRSRPSLCDPQPSRGTSGPGIRYRPAGFQRDSNGTCHIIVEAEPMDPDARTARPTRSGRRSNSGWGTEIPRGQSSDSRQLIDLLTSGFRVLSVGAPSEHGSRPQIEYRNSGIRRDGQGIYNIVEARPRFANVTTARPTCSQQRSDSGRSPPRTGGGRRQTSRR